MMYENELRVALSAVRSASRLCQNVRATLITEETITKKDRSPVTIADLGAQALISRELLNAFPRDPLVAEEDADLLRQDEHGENRRKVLEHVAAIAPALSAHEVLAAIDRGRHNGGLGGRFWTTDPIDGTKGYIRGDQYAVALALIEEGRVVLGVMGCPNLPARSLAAGDQPGLVIYATRGGGTFAEPLEGGAPAALHVAEIVNPSAAVVCQSVEAAHTSHGRAAWIAGALGITASSVGLDSQCKYAVVARGEASLYMRLPAPQSTYEEKIWDHAAGWIAVKEAGGEVTDTAGNALDFSLGRTLRANKGVVATSGRIHADVITAVRAIMTED